MRFCKEDPADIASDLEYKISLYPSMTSIVIVSNEEWLRFSSQEFFPKLKRLLGLIHSQSPRAIITLAGLFTFDYDERVASEALEYNRVSKPRLAIGTLSTLLSKNGLINKTNSAHSLGNTRICQQICRFRQLFRPRQNGARCAHHLHLQSAAKTRPPLPRALRTNKIAACVFASLFVVYSRFFLGAN